jgi:DNA-binding transcriptional LysR family regulator
VDYNRTALFVKVVKAGSFTAAATAAGLPKSSVSRAVSQLEKELGVRLLQRTTRKLALTEVGQSFYDTVSASVSAIEHAGTAARDRGPAPTGTVRLTAAPDSVGLAPLLAQFMRKHPGIRIELVLTSRFVDLVAEGIDIAVRAGRLADSSLVGRRIGTTEGALMAAPAYLRRRGRPRSIADLAAHDWVLFRATGGRASLTLTGPDGDRTVEVEGALVADNMAFCRAAAEAGIGIALLPIPAVVESLAAGRLEQVLPGWSYGGASLSILLPTGRHVPARVALLRDFLVDEMSRELAQINQHCQLAKERRAAPPPPPAARAGRRRQRAA